MYIQAIQIRNFWQQVDIKWALNPDVNVLIGENGVGKTTILNLIYEILKKNELDIDVNLFNSIDDMAVKFSDDTFTLFDVEGRKGNVEVSKFSVNKISTFDTEDSVIKQLVALRESFYKYQRDLSKRIEDLLSEEDESELGKKPLNEIKNHIFGKKKLFIEKLNALFHNTGKTFEEENFVFIKKGHKTPIEITQLSSGEKQVMLLLLTALLQRDKPCILLLDEPEISLHLEWQRRIIQDILSLNSNCQLIIATHSPSIYFNGWNHCKFHIEDIITQITFENDLALPRTEHAEEVADLQNRLRNLGNLYQINREISNHYGDLSITECNTMIKFIKDGLKVTPDSYTYTTLMSKIVSAEGRNGFFDQMKKAKVKPTVVTYNVLIKKATSVAEGIAFLEKMQLDKLSPDIITFSTLLGKSKIWEETAQVENWRKYFSVLPNELYMNKLRAKF
ncbi:MAG: AAA family ATPase [Bacteroidia bacterium]